MVSVKDNGSELESRESTSHSSRIRYIHLRANNLREEDMTISVHPPPPAVDYLVGLVLVNRYLQKNSYNLKNIVWILIPGKRLVSRKTPPHTHTK